MTAFDVRYEPELHRYTINGEQWPSVSEILRPLVEAEYAFAIANKADAMEKARTIGTYMAQAIDLDLAGTLDEDDLDPRLIPRFESWREFRRKSGFEMLLCETIIKEPRFHYCGRLDLFGTLPAKRGKVEFALIDTKATASIIRTVRPQTAAYVDALIASGPNVIPHLDLSQHEIKRYALHIPEPPNKWKLVPLNDSVDFRVFRARATLFHCWEKEKRT